MVERTQALSHRPATDRWLAPLPHPSRSGENALPAFAQPLAAAEFWNRLGL